MQWKRCIQCAPATSRCCMSNWALLWKANYLHLKFSGQIAESWFRLLLEKEVCCMYQICKWHCLDCSSASIHSHASVMYMTVCPVKHNQKMNMTLVHACSQLYCCLRDWSGGLINTHWALTEVQLELDMCTGHGGRSTGGLPTCAGYYLAIWQPCLVCRKWSSCVDWWYMSGGILSQVLTAAWQSWGQVIHCDSGDWIATYILTNYWYHSNNHCSYSQVYSFMTAIKKWMLHTDLRPLPSFNTL